MANQKLIEGLEKAIGELPALNEELVSGLEDAVKLAKEEAYEGLAHLLSDVSLGLGSVLTLQTLAEANKDE